MELSPSDAAVLEALLDERLGVDRAALPADVVADLEARGALGPGGREALAAHVVGRRLEWVSRPETTQGEVLEAFAAFCRDELDDLEVVESSPTGLRTRWRREETRFELRAGFRGCERIPHEGPLVLLGDAEPEYERLLQALVDDAELRSRLLVLDLGRLEKIGAVRSSAFVHLEWFLRDAYGVKLLPAARFTQALIDRGIISLGMG